MLLCTTSCVGSLSHLSRRTIDFRNMSPLDAAISMNYSEDRLIEVIDNCDIRDLDTGGPYLRPLLDNIIENGYIPVFKHLCDRMPSPFMIHVNNVSSMFRRCIDKDARPLLFLVYRCAVKILCTELNDTTTEEVCRLRLHWETIYTSLHVSEKISVSFSHFIPKGYEMTLSEFFLILPERYIIDMVEHSPLSRDVFHYMCKIHPSDHHILVKRAFDLCLVQSLAIQSKFVCWVLYYGSLEHIQKYCIGASPLFCDAIWLSEDQDYISRNSSPVFTLLERITTSFVDDRAGMIRECLYLIEWLPCEFFVRYKTDASHSIISWCLRYWDNIAVQLLGPLLRKASIPIYTEEVSRHVFEAIWHITYGWIPLFQETNIPIEDQEVYKRVVQPIDGLESFDLRTEYTVAEQVLVAFMCNPLNEGIWHEKKSGRTLLHRLCRIGEFEIAKQLLDTAKNPHILVSATDNDGRNARDYANDFIDHIAEEDGDADTLLHALRIRVASLFPVSAKGAM